MKKTLYILFIVLLSSSNVFNQSVGFKGQLPMWTTINPEEPFQWQTGIRYIPELSFDTPIKESFSLDGEFSINTYITSYYENDTIELDEKLKPYRMWMRFSTDNFEIRAGLQKINFGSANIIRPLMWFDQIDPKDPLQLTDGVYGVLGRYYFMNNANIWLWGLVGNDKPKGLELFPSVVDKPEFGGRVQLPFFTGEIASTYHHRTFDFFNNTYPENRYALDLKIDKVIGFWAEATLVHQDFTDSTKYKKALNIGLDYTFNLGNGLGMMTEFFVIDNNDEIKVSDNAMALVATSLNYSINIISNISLMAFYFPDENSIGTFANYSMTYDKWSFFFMTFILPDKMQLPGITGEVSLYSGYGFQLMAVFNH